MGIGTAPQHARCGMIVTEYALGSTEGNVLISDACINSIGGNLSIAVHPVTGKILVGTCPPTASCDKRRCIVTMFDPDATNPIVIIGDIISNDDRLCLGMRPDATEVNGLLVGIGIDHASFAGRCRISEYGDGKVTPICDAKAIDGLF